MVNKLEMGQTWRWIGFLYNFFNLLASTLHALNFLQELAYLYALHIRTMEEACYSIEKVTTLSI